MSVLAIFLILVVGTSALVYASLRIAIDHRENRLNITRYLFLLALLGAFGGITALYLTAPVAAKLDQCHNYGLGFLLLLTLAWFAGTFVMVIPIRLRYCPNWARSFLAWLIGSGASGLLLLILILPFLLHAGSGNKLKQRRTLADIRNTGTALISWAGNIPDKQIVSSGWQGSKTMGEPAVSVGLDVGPYQKVSHEEVLGLLHPSSAFFYMKEAPQVDGWGNSIEFRFFPGLTSPTSIMLRSPGCDGEFDGERHIAGPFLATDYQRDIVWADGYFVSWPSAAAH